MDEKLTIWNPGTGSHIKPYSYQARKEPAYHDAQIIEEPEEKKTGRRPRLDLGRFCAQNRDIVRNIAIMIVVAIISSMITHNLTAAKLSREYDVQLKSAVFRAEQQLATQMRDEYGLTEAEELERQLQEWAKIIAKVLYPMRNNTVKGLRSAVWSVLDRYDSPNYDGDILDLCSSSGVYMGWDENNPVLDNLYSIALKELHVWASGIRPFGYEYVFIRWSPKEIILLDSLDGNAHYWYEDDWDAYDEAHSS